MAGLFGSPQVPTVQAPPPVPSLSDAAVQDQTREEMRRRALAQGRASTMLMDPSTQLSPDASKAPTALGGT